MGGGVGWGSVGGCWTVRCWFEEMRSRFGDMRIRDQRDMSLIKEQMTLRLTSCEFLAQWRGYHKSHVYTE